MLHTEPLTSERLGVLAMSAEMAFDPVASHASCMENFPWMQLADIVLPPEQKAPIDLAHVRQLNPHEARACLGAGNYAGM